MRKILLALVVLCGGLYLYLPYVDAPQREGTLTMPSLSAQVRVLRGDDGVPYVYADSLDDALTAQGFIHAQDRLFQMEVFKFVSHGRLAELFGERGLSIDRIVRLVDISAFAKERAAVLNTAERNFLQRYLNGVNDYIATRSDEFPIMLGVVGRKPEPWTMEDILAVQYFRIWSSSVNWKQELLTLRLMDRFGPLGLEQLLPIGVNPDDPRTELNGAVSALDTAITSLDLSYDDSLFSDFEARTAMGSDAWASGSARSSNGAPILSSDPHLDARTLPGFWYPMGIVTPELRAVGGSTPGGPGIGVGRNAHVAWGATNGYSDMVDLFVESVDADNDANYLEGESSIPFAIRTEKLLIKDKDVEGGYRSETMTIRETSRGAIISDHGMSLVEGKVLSLRWSVPEYVGVQEGNRKLLLATSVDDAVTAIGEISTPLNYIVADVAGNIARVSSGLVPVRVKGDGLIPLHATAIDNWLGRIPPAQMPLQLNPAKGWVGSANNRVTDADYPYTYTTHFAGSWRYRRVMQLMEEGQLSTDDHWAANMDIKNLLAQRMRPAMIAAMQTDSELQPLAKILDEWDLMDDKDQAAPLVFQSVFRQLAIATFADEMDDELLSDFLRESYYWQERFLLQYESNSSPWFDDSRTDEVESRDDLILRAGRLAMSELSERWGGDPSSWRWGAAHTVSFKHPFIPGDTAAKWIGGGIHPASGSGETLNRGVYYFDEAYEVRIIDSMRIIMDLSDNDKVEAHYPGGVSERWFDPWNKNFLDAWLSGERRYWWLSDTAISKNTNTLQILQP